MIFFFLGLILLLLFLLILQIISSAPPASVKQILKFMLFWGIIFLCGILMLRGLWGIAVPLLFTTLPLLRGLFKGRRKEMGGHTSKETIARIRTEFFEMALDQSSGVITGRVLQGQFSGKMLAQLQRRELHSLWQEVSCSRGSRESQILFETYLDRQFPDWRDYFDQEAASGTQNAAQSALMDEEEAYEILGLAPGASMAEIKAAYHKLMKRCHPDQGGTRFLAAQLNRARDRLMEKRPK